MKMTEYSSYMQKMKKIKKYFKKDRMYLELYVFNYEGYYFYITINYIKKLKVYKLSWFDLNVLDENKMEKYVNYVYISNELIDRINVHYCNYIVNSQYQGVLESGKNVVKLNAYIQTKGDDMISVSFYKYLPKSLECLADLFIIIFKNLPKKLENFLFEILAALNDNTGKYEYKKEFSFNLFDDDMDKIFAYQIVERGKQYYEEKNVLFLEKIDDKYFAIVEGTEKYLVIIKYNEKDSIIQVYCSCPCEFYYKHIYAVILAIRNNDFYHFSKVMYKNPNKGLIESIMELDYFLCLGVIEQNLEIVNNYGELELVPILDINSQCNWKVLEDTEDEQLEKQIYSVIHDSNKI